MWEPTEEAQTNLKKGQRLVTSSPTKTRLLDGSPALNCQNFNASGFDEAGEIGAVTPEEEERKGGDNQRDGQAGAVNEDVEAEDVDDDRPEQGEAERDEAADQEQQSPGDLEGAHNVHVAGIHQRAGERGGLALWARRGRRDEVEKDVQAEDNKGEPEEDADDDGGDFHGAIFNGDAGIATKKAGREEGSGKRVSG